MKLENLIAQAYEQSSEFKRKWEYWVVTRRKKPDDNWLFKSLEDALGSSFVEAAAQDEVERKEAEFRQASIQLTPIE